MCRLNLGVMSFSSVSDFLHNLCCGLSRTNNSLPPPVSTRLPPHLPLHINNTSESITEFTGSKVRFSSQSRPMFKVAQHTQASWTEPAGEPGSPRFGASPPTPSTPPTVPPALTPGLEVGHRAASFLPWEHLGPRVTPLLSQPQRHDPIV